MALLTFPPNPLSGDLYPTAPLPGQNQYKWSAADSTWRLEGVAIGVTVGTYGNTGNVGQFTVDAQGRITSAANVPITFPTTLTFATAPTASTDAGVSGEIAVDGTYLYLYGGTQWQRIAWDTTPW